MSKGQIVVDARMHSTTVGGIVYIYALPAEIYKSSKGIETKATDCDVKKAMQKERCGDVGV